MTDTDHDLAIVGAGPAGLSCGVFAARNGLDTVIVHDGASILRRNAIVENYLGFPEGVDSRRLLAMGAVQAERSGCGFVEAHVERVDRIGGEGAAASGCGDDGGDGHGEDGGHDDEHHRGPFELRTGDGDALTADRVVAASWADASYVEHLDPEGEQRGSKWFFDVDDGGRTSVEGLYAAGRIADRPHQAIVNAGHGAQVALAAIHDSSVAFYHDWVAPEGYFTGRGRDVPPGCAEIADDERRERAEAARQATLDRFGEPFGEEPVPHPSLAGDG